MSLLIPTGQERPSRLKETKNMDYHSRFGRYCAGDANTGLRSAHLEKIELNKRFYKGDQWVSDEDTELFLKDDTNQSRNRIKIIKNLIRPMVEQYRGNAIRMNINFKAKSVSPRAINRREKALATMKFHTRNAAQSPFGDMLRKRLPIGKTEGETEVIFNNTYIDKFVEKINYLITYVSDLNEFGEKQIRTAEEMALSGMTIMETFEWAGNQRFDIVPTEEFFWDRSAKKYDLSDSDYMGKERFMLPTEIYEQFPNMDPLDRIAIDEYTQKYRQQATAASLPYQGARIPVLYTYWRDSEVYEYGYVKDEFGYPYLTKINFVYEGETKPRYTDKDLVIVDSERSKRILRGQKKRDLVVDALRMCIFIAKEAISTTENNKDAKDIVLDWGLVPYQESDNLDLNNVRFPFKCYCWGYINGEVLSPVDDAINPQRFINRVLSVTENQINNSRGSGTVYDKSALDQEEGEDGMLRNMNQSKPVGFNAKGRGIQNIIGSYDSTVKQGTMVLFNIVDAMKGSIQDTTGVNEALKGESTGSDQLVGVTQLLMQRGSLMQEPFYYAITNVFLQAFQSIASTGKRIYADNERELAIAVGDDGVETISISKEMKAEDFRVFVKRENVDEVLIQAGNGMITQLAQLGFLDRKRFANLWGRSTPDDVATALRESVKDQDEVARMQKEEQDKSAQQMVQTNAEEKQGQQMQMNNLLAREDQKDAQNKQHDIDKIFAKSMAKGLEQAPTMQAPVSGAIK